MDKKLLFIFINGKRVTDVPCKDIPDEVFLLGGLSGTSNHS